MNEITKLFKLALVGICIGCTIMSFVLVIIALSVGYESYSLSGAEIINSVLGAIVVGLGFALPSLIYENENIALPYQTIFQMGIGFIILILVGAYLEWIPLNQGIFPIIEWILIVLIFAFAIWFGFYLYEKNEANKINEQLNKLK